MTPIELLKACLTLEYNMGRIRKRKWGERLIDIDILYFRDLVLKATDLEIPHPGIPGRKFTLVPLVEKWAQLIHPVLKKNQLQLLTELNSSSGKGVILIIYPPELYISIYLIYP